MKEPRWTLSSLLDFELLLEQDRRLEPAELRERDRGFEAGAISRNELLHAWLEQRRTEQGGSRVGVMERALHLAGAVGSLVAGSAGVGIALGFLQYRGEQLINVTAFLAVAVGLQLLGLLGTGALWALRRSRPQSGEWLLETLRVPAMRRQLPMSFSLLQRRMFSMLQLWGIALNVGILACLLFRVTFYDLAFGWASTLEVSSDQIQGLVHALAFPWHSWIPDAVPTLAQIQGSRIVLTEGLAQPTASGVTVWWRFLWLAVLAYGLVPRFLLWWGAVFGLRRSLAGLEFSSAACEALVLRLRPAVVEHPPIVTNGATEASAHEGVGLSLIPPVGSFTILLPSGVELADEVHPILGRGFGITVAGVTSSFSDCGQGGCLLLMEAWRPPLEETLEEIRELRTRMDSGKILFIGLIGMMEEGHPTPPAAGEVAMWRSVLNRGLQDASIGILPWGLE